MRRKKHQKACHYHPGAQHLPGSLFRATFPVEIVKLEDNSFHLLVKVEIDGIAGDMIIDTGASVTVISQDLFPEKISVQPAVTMQSGSVTGQIKDIRVVRADSFRIQGYTLKNVPLAAIDLEYVNHMYAEHLQRKIIGLLGCDFCVKYKAVINYRTQEMSLNLSGRKPSL